MTANYNVNNLLVM